VAITSILAGTTEAGGYVLPSQPNRPARILGRLGALETRLATNASEVREAQALRYNVFFREMAARPGALAKFTRRDSDGWDRICDHLLLVDRSNGNEKVVGTYRLLRAAVAERAGKALYTQSEFNIAALLRRHPGLNFMELGRSCILPPWRNKRSIELLWHGSWAYVLEHKIDAMLGCASFPTSNPDSVREALSFLFHCAAPDPEWDVRAIDDKSAPFDPMPVGEIDRRRALAGLPPLIKGYLRLGAWIGREAVVDRRFGTTDVLIILPISRLNPRYVAYYGAEAGRHSAVIGVSGESKVT
jgi:L-ornithine Nalpha-acyltransferase